MTTAATPTRPEVQPGRGVGGFLDALEIDTRLLGMAAALAVIWIGFDLATGGVFLTARNLWNLAVQTSVVGIVATGMVLVIVTRNIDLSVGSVLGVLGMIMAVVQVEWLPPLVGLENWSIWILAVLAGAVCGVAIGAAQGWWVAYRGVPSFIVTLGGLLVFRGLAWWITSGRTVAPMDTRFQMLGGGVTGSIEALWSWVVGLVGIAFIVLGALRTRAARRRYGFPTRPMWAELTVVGVAVLGVAAFVQVMNSYDYPARVAARLAAERGIVMLEGQTVSIAAGIPIPVLILIGVALVMSFIATRTRFGRYVFAIGGNPEAADLAGVNTRRIILLIFVLMGVLAAVAGAVQTARLNAGANSTGTLLELSAIAAAVIGGTSLAGGVGTIAGALLGALVMQSLQSGMLLMDVDTPLQQIVIGLVLVVAVWIDAVYQKRRR